MISFDAAHKAIHYPPDRRFRIWIRPSFIAGIVALILLPLLFAWGQAAVFGLPYIPPVPQFIEVAPKHRHSHKLELGFCPHEGDADLAPGDVSKTFPVLIVD